MTLEFKNIIGETFGRLTILRRVRSEERRLYYLCRCECGREKVAYRSHLLRGHTRSCGCLNLEAARINIAKAVHFNRVGRPARDRAGERYGRLVVIDELKVDMTRRSFRCRCDCGTLKIVKRQNLDQGNTKSCGCLKMEKDRVKMKCMQERQRAKK